jgi:hypothetical protein
VPEAERDSLLRVIQNARWVSEKNVMQSRYELMTQIVVVKNL